MAKTGYIEEMIQQARGELAKAGVPERRINAWRATVQFGNICYPGDLPASGWKRYDGKPLDAPEEFLKAKMDPLEMWAKLYCVAVAYLEAMRSQSSDVGILAREFGALDERLLSRGWQSAAGKHFGKAGGKKGEKPGRPYVPPPPVAQLRKEFEIELAKCGSHREARANLAKRLKEENPISIETARGWLREARIKSKR